MEAFGFDVSQRFVYHQKEVVSERAKHYIFI